MILSITSSSSHSALSLPLSPTSFLPPTQAPMLGEKFAGGTAEATGLLNKLVLASKAKVIRGKKRDARTEGEGQVIAILAKVIQ